MYGRESIDRPGVENFLLLTSEQNDWSVRAILYQHLAIQSQLLRVAIASELLSKNLEDASFLCCLVGPTNEIISPWCGSGYSLPSPDSSTARSRCPSSEMYNAKKGGGVFSCLTQA